MNDAGQNDIRGKVLQLKQLDGYCNPWSQNPDGSITSSLLEAEAVRKAGMVLNEFSGIGRRYDKVSDNPPSGKLTLSAGDIAAIRRDFGFEFTFNREASPPPR